jgi:hypothetical protein
MWPRHGFPHGTPLMVDGCKILERSGFEPATSRMGERLGRRLGYQPAYLLGLNLNQHNLYLSLILFYVRVEKGWGLAPTLDYMTTPWNPGLQS